jgi:enoyl-CoA hydratase/carnithine racemase
MSQTAVETASRTLVHYEVRDGVAYLRLDDPPANTYTHEMMKQLDEGILRARFDAAVHVIVVTGTGEKMFCAGANINMLKASDPYFKYFFCLHANETLSRLEQTPKLVIAALNGHTVGGGLEIAMAADIRIGMRNTTVPREKQPKMGLPEVALGVLPGTGGTQRMARLVNKATAIELMVEGTTFDFERGQALGLVNQIWDAASVQEFMDKVQAYAEKFCPPHKASKAVGRIKRSVQSGAEIPFESALAVERELQQLLFQGDDAK